MSADRFQGDISMCLSHLHFWNFCKFGHPFLDDKTYCARIVPLLFWLSDDIAALLSEDILLSWGAWQSVLWWYRATSGGYWGSCRGRGLQLQTCLQPTIGQGGSRTNLTRTLGQLVNPLLHKEDMKLEIERRICGDVSTIRCGYDPIISENICITCVPLEHPCKILILLHSLTLCKICDRQTNKRTVDGPAEFRSFRMSFFLRQIDLE